MSARYPAYIAFLFLLIVYSAETIARNMAWKDETVLWQDVAVKSPNSPRGHYNLGTIYRETGKMEKAIREWEKTVELSPFYSEANNALGNVALLRGDYPEAIHRYGIAIKGNPKNAEAHYNIAITLEKMGKTDEAVFHYREFIVNAEAGYQKVVEKVKTHLMSLRVEKER
ncbi:MAG: tetratricopeptide repeat protein [Deltaproteobacteria bacterium]|nr:tetratricopeptide repeat protein [Deltaproteobacteria bacterium]MBI3754914.1 tetratricopeptide repeat protein [Deltaproteobacteria bacterium]